MSDLPIPAHDNLLRHIDPDKDKLAVEPPGFYQDVVLDAVTLLFAVGFGYTYRNFIAGAISGWWVLGVITALGVCSGLQALLIKNPGRRILVIVGEMVVIGAFFYDSNQTFLIAALVLAFGFFTLGYWETRQELRSSTTIRFFTVTKGVLGKFVTGILLLMILLYVPLQTSPTLFIPESSFASFFTWSVGVAQVWYPSLPLTGSFGNLAKTLVEGQLKNNPDFQALSPTDQIANVSTNESRLITNFSGDLGFTVHASDTVASVAYNFIMKTLAGWNTRFAGAFVVGWSVLIFVTLRSVGIVFVWFSQLLLALLYEILLGIKVIKIREHPAVQEVIEF